LRLLTFDCRTDVEHVNLANSCDEGEEFAAVAEVEAAHLLRLPTSVKPYFCLA